MTSIKLIVTGASARAEVDGLLTSGMVGIPVTIVCDGAWDGLTKALVCRGGSIVKTILNVGCTATVAHECMVPNQTLFIGIEGRNADGTLVIPTVWARCGLICSGANADADPSTDPTLPVWARIESKIGSLDNLNTQAKDNLVAAVNEAMEKGGGIGIDTSLTVSGKAADAAVVGEKFSELSDEIANIPNGGSGLTTEQANALDGMFKVCAFTKADISAEYNAFCTAFGIEAATITGISATYSGGDVAVGTAVTDLTGIVVTAHYSDGTSKTVTGYTLSGTIADGSNTITVTYEGMTTTFTVTGVAEEVTLSSISATYSGGDVAVGTAVTDLTGIVVTAHYSDGTSKTVTGYTLSGTIADGSNTVTVTYQGKTTTFMVTGTAESGDGDGTEWTDGVPYEYSLVENEYVDRNSGGFVAYSGWSRTPYLPCKGASNITAVYVDSGGAKLTGSYGAWYTAEKTWINNFNQSAIITSIPENACFVVFSQADANMQNIASITPTA